MIARLALQWRLIKPLLLLKAAIKSSPFHSKYLTRTQVRRVERPRDAERADEQVLPLPAERRVRPAVPDLDLERRAVHHCPHLGNHDSAVTATPGCRSGVIFNQVSYACMYRGDHGGLALDFVDFHSGVLPVIPFAMPSLLNFHHPKHDWADRRSNHIKVYTMYC